LVVHASPDAPGVDLLVDDLVMNTSALEYPDNTGYLGIGSGDRNIKVNASGTEATVIDADLNLMPGMNYSIFATDEVAEIAPLVLTDDLSSPASGNAHVRFIHLSPDAPAVDITLTDGTIVFGDYSFGEYSDFTPLSASTYDLQVRLQGTDTVVLNLPGIMLEDGHIYTVFAKGFVGGEGDQALGAEIIVNM
jgi:DNA-binding beta-propeller fold protein YncE